MQFRQHLVKFIKLDITYLVKKYNNLCTTHSVELTVQSSENAKLTGF